MDDIRYCWSKWYEDLEKGLQDLEKLHEALKDFDDYNNNRILIHMDPPHLLEVVVFKSSNTYLRIREDYEIEEFSFDIIWRF